MFYGMNGEPLTIIQFSKLYENKKRVLKQERVLGGKVFLSTVLLGIDHGFGLSKKPIIFETMAFCEYSFGRNDFGFSHHEVFQTRYTTKEDAMLGHRLVKKLGLTPRWFIRHLITEHVFPWIKQNLSFIYPLRR